VTADDGAVQDFADYEGRDLEVMQCLENYRQWIFDEMAPHLSGRIVEIGAGTGNFSELLVSPAEGLVLVEPGHRPYQVLERRFGGLSGVETVSRDAAEWVRQAPDESVQSIVMINVLEHIEADVDLLEDLFRVLRPGGKLCLYVPAMMLPFSELDRQYGHFRRYGGRELREKLLRTNFRIVHGKYMDSAGMLAWFLLYRLMKGTDFNPRMASFYDRVAVPVLRRAERFVPPPAGKNPLFIAERPSDLGTGDMGADR
jgi:SAM-dependent methyltransferase